MERRIIAICQEITAFGKSLKLTKADKEYLYSVCHSHNIVENKELGLLVFRLEETDIYNGLEDVLRFIITSSVPQEVSTVFDNPMIKGIIDCPYDEGYYLYLLGNSGRKEREQKDKEFDSHKIDFASLAELSRQMTQRSGASQESEAEEREGQRLMGITSEEYAETPPPYSPPEPDVMVTSTTTGYTTWANSVRWVRWDEAMPTSNEEITP